MESAIVRTEKNYTLRELAIYFFKLGSTGFGGPVALVGYMHRDLVEKRKWITENDYREGLALAQLAPGPLAAQLAIYIGYIDFKIIGATLAGLAFVIPSFLMVLLLGFAYVEFGGLAWMQSVFYGIGAAVIGIIAVSTYKLTTKTMGSDWLMWLIFLGVGLTTFLAEREIVWLILSCGFLVCYIRTKSKFNHSNSLILSPFILQIAHIFSTDEKLVQIGWFFLKAGAFVFGSGLAIVPFLYGGVVKEYQWLNEQKFLDAVSGTMVTPGPVGITVGFIGYLVAGLPGGCVAAL